MRVPSTDKSHGQPLYVSNVSVQGQGVHNVVYVATMNDVAYAFDADSNAGSNASPLWTVSFVNPSLGITAIPATDLSNGGNVTGNVGIESTPVIDLPSNTIFLLVRTKENGSYVQRLHALDITSGAEQPNSPVVITGSIAGIGQGAVGNLLTFDPKIQNQRASLAIANHSVLIAWASPSGSEQLSRLGNQLRHHVAAANGSGMHDSERHAGGHLDVRLGSGDRQCREHVLHGWERNLRRQTRLRRERD